MLMRNLNALRMTAMRAQANDMQLTRMLYTACADLIAERRVALEDQIAMERDALFELAKQGRFEYTERASANAATETRFELSDIS